MSAPIVIGRSIAATGVSVSIGSGGVNLLTDDPKEAWIAGTSGPVSAVLDLGSVKSIDFVYLGSFNGAAGATWSVTYSASASTGLGNTLLPATAAPVPRSKAGLMHLFVRASAAVSARYIRVALNQAGGGPNVTAGILRAGTCFRPAWGQEWGGGRAPIDTGIKERLPSGGFGIDPGVRKSAFQWTFGDLTDEEREELYAFCLEVGETAPFVLVEDIGSGTPATAESVHWCTFDRLDYYERRDPRSSRWAFRVEEWV